MKKPIIDSIKIMVTIDEAPDLSHLDQFKDSTDPDEQRYYQEDQERLRQYNEGRWNCICISAAAAVWIPNEQGGYNTHRITSPGLWGIESNSGVIYFNSVAREECDSLFHDLKALNVALRGYSKKVNEAMSDFIMDL